MSKASEVRLRAGHSGRLEELAALHDLNPLHVLEWFLERAAIREFDGAQTRAEAEAGALRDIEEWLS